MATDPVIVRHGFRAEVRKPRSAASGGDVDALTPVTATEVQMRANETRTKASA